MFKMIIPVSLPLLLICGSAVAGVTEMVCKNPRQGYQVTFDDAASTFRLGAPGKDTFYTVERVEKDESGSVVRGKTAKDGPDFIAYLGGKKRIEFIDGGEVFQTDPCK